MSGISLMSTVSYWGSLGTADSKNTGQTLIVDTNCSISGSPFTFTAATVIFVGGCITLNGQNLTLNGAMIAPYGQMLFALTPGGSANEVVSMANAPYLSPQWFGIVSSGVYTQFLPDGDFTKTPGSAGSEYWTGVVTSILMSAQKAGVPIYPMR